MGRKSNIVFSNGVKTQTNVVPEDELIGEKLPFSNFRHGGREDSIMKAVNHGLRHAEIHDVQPVHRTISRGLCVVPFRQGRSRECRVDAGTLALRARIRLFNLKGHLILLRPFRAGKPTSEARGTS